MPPVKGSRLVVFGVHDDRRGSDWAIDHLLHGVVKQGCSQALAQIRFVDGETAQKRCGNAGITANIFLFGIIFCFDARRRERIEALAMTFVSGSMATKQAARPRCMSWLATALR